MLRSSFPNTLFRNANHFHLFGMFNLGILSKRNKRAIFENGYDAQKVDFKVRFALRLNWTQEKQTNASGQGVVFKSP